MKEPVELNENVTRALRTLGRAPLPEGMEDRIIGRMRERQAEHHSAVQERSAWLRWIFAAALAASVVMIVLVGRHHATAAATANHLVANLPGRETPQPATAIARLETPPDAVRSPLAARLMHAHAPQTSASAPSLSPPLLPLTQQEQLLLALAHAPQIGPSLGSVTTSETVVDHGLGKNSILELDHEELKPLKTTLQLTQLSTLPKPNLSGETE